MFFQENAAIMTGEDQRKWLWTISWCIFNIAFRGSLFCVTPYSAFKLFFFLQIIELFSEVGAGLRNICFFSVVKHQK